MSEHTSRIGMAVYTEVIAVSVAYLGVITGFAYQIARAAGIA